MKTVESLNIFYNVCYNSFFNAVMNTESMINVFSHTQSPMLAGVIAAVHALPCIDDRLRSPFYIHKASSLATHTAHTHSYTQSPPLP